MLVTNAFGIDFQRTLTNICLREGQGINARLRNVGDGIRRIIPHVVWNDSLSGSQAMKKPEIERVEPEFLFGEPVWLDNGALVFWKNLNKRLTNYLGRLSPTRHNGYQIVVTIPTINFSITEVNLKVIGEKAGFDDLIIISQVDALLCRWLVNAKFPAKNNSIITAVAIGDTNFSVKTYRLEQSPTSFPKIKADLGPPINLDEIGAAFWNKRWTEKLESRFREDFSSLKPSDYNLLMGDAALRFASRLARAETDDEDVIFTDLFDELIYSPLRVSRNQSHQIFETLDFNLRLSGMVRESVSRLGIGMRPDIILIGGIGAVWPFAADILSGQGSELWQSENPIEDFAVGAAWWSEFNNAFDISNYGNFTNRLISGNSSI